MFKARYSSAGSQTNPVTHKSEAYSTEIIIQGDFNGQVFNVNENGEVPIAVDLTATSDYFPDNNGSLTCNTCQVQNFNVTSHTIVGLSLETLEVFEYESNPGGTWNREPGSLIGFDIINKTAAWHGDAQHTRTRGHPPHN